MSLKRQITNLVMLTMLTILTCGVQPAEAEPLKILLAEPSDMGTDVLTRLAGLGHEVTVSAASSWGSSFDYSPYDVVAFQFTSGSPGDVQHLVAAVDSDSVGVVFFRGGFFVETVAAELGLIAGGELGFQQPAVVEVLDTSHYITSSLLVGPHDLGYTYMSRVSAPGAATTTLATGPDGPALVVHNTRRAVITPFYGNPKHYQDETPTGLQITERSLEWAAGAVPEPPTLALLLIAAGILRAYVGRRRRRQKQSPTSRRTGVFVHARR
jgi:hypothetical protein